MDVGRPLRVLLPRDEGATALAEEAVAPGYRAVVAQHGLRRHAGKGADGDGVQVEQEGAGLLAAGRAEAFR